MNTAVLYAKTFNKYKKAKCPDRLDTNCIYEVWDGQEYFDEYVLNTKGKKNIRYKKITHI